MALHGLWGTGRERCETLFSSYSLFGAHFLAIATVLCDSQAKFTFPYCSVPQGPTLSLVCHLRKSAARIKWLQPVLPALNIHLIYEKSIINLSLLQMGSMQQTSPEVPQLGELPPPLLPAGLGRVLETPQRTVLLD